MSGRQKLESYYLYHSLLGEIHRRQSDPASAKAAFEKAIALTQSKTEKRLLENKIAALDGPR